MWFPYLTQDCLDIEPESEEAKKDAEFPVQYVANVGDGATIGYKYFDCENTTVSGMTQRGYAGGIMEERTSVGGVICGTFPVNLRTEDWITVDTDVKLPDGKQALYFTYCGTGAVDCAEFELKNKILE